MIRRGRVARKFRGTGRFPRGKRRDRMLGIGFVEILATAVRKAELSSDDQIFAWRKEARAQLIANLLSIDPVDRRQHAGKIALNLLSKRTAARRGAMSAERSADVGDGVEAFALGGTETPPKLSRGARERTYHAQVTDFRSVPIPDVASSTTRLPRVDASSSPMGWALDAPRSCALANAVPPR